MVRFSFLSPLLSTASLFGLLLISAQAQSPSNEVAKALSEQIGDFRAKGRISDALNAPIFDGSPESYSVISATSRHYRSLHGGAYIATLVRTRSNSAAYSLLTKIAGYENAKVGAYKIDLGGAEAVSAVVYDGLAFVKGSTFIVVTPQDTAAPSPYGRTSVSDDVISLTRAIAGSIDAPSGQFPVLVLHLPEWEQTQASAGYAVSLPALQHAAGDRPVLNALSFDGGAEAVTARYGDARLVIVEFTTPQYAAESDGRINERIAQLRAEGQPAPSAYKRVGNYSVFVFDAPDRATAERLLTGVKYEKDVRWLGRNPHGDEIAQRAYVNTMTGVIVTVIKTTGLAILLCFGVGALFGGVVFLRRRARVSAQEVFSDAGGMVRLDLAEDIPATAPPAGLLGRGKE